MRFRKNVPAEHREFLQEQLKQYKKEITMSKDGKRKIASTCSKSSDVR